MKKLMMGVLVAAAVAAPAAAGRSPGTAALEGPAYRSLRGIAQGSGDATFDNNTRKGTVLASWGGAEERTADGVLIVHAPTWIDSPRDGNSGSPAFRMKRNCGGFAGCLDKASRTETGSKTVARSAFVGGLLGAVVTEALTHSFVAA